MQHATSAEENKGFVKSLKGRWKLDRFFFHISICLLDIKHPAAVVEFLFQRNKTQVRCFTCETQLCYRMEKGHVREQNGCQLSEQGWNAWVTEKKKAVFNIKSTDLWCGVRYNFEEAKWDSNPKPHDCILHKTCRYRMCREYATYPMLTFTDMQCALFPSAIRAPLLTNPVLLAWCTMILSMLPYHLKLDQMFRAQHNRLRTQTSLHKL